MEHVLMNLLENRESATQIVDQLNKLFEGFPLEAELICADYETVDGEKCELNGLSINNLLINYYFSFGTNECFPYQGGYVLVKAHSKQEAVEKYRKKYPDVEEGIINCAFIYNQFRWDEAHEKMPEYIQRKEICHEVIV